MKTAVTLTCSVVTTISHLYSR